MGKKKKITTYNKYERLDIAISIAEAIEAGSTIVKECKERKISRMSLCNWQKKSPVIKGIIAEALKNRRAALAKKRRDELAPSWLIASRPAGWRVLKKHFVFKEEASVNNFIINCCRCGHKWRARSFPVTKCSFPTCQTEYFNVPRFSDAEKRIAAARRLDSKSKRKRSSSSSHQCRLDQTQ